MWGKRLSIFLLVLLVASFCVWAFPGRLTRSPDALQVDTSDPVVPVELPKTDSGMIPETDLTESSTALLEEVAAEVDPEVVQDLEAIRDNLAALEAVSQGKDAVIDTLADENVALAVAAEEAGSKAFLMIDSILGFEQGAPTYGVGVSLGVRLGDSLMIHAGADYDLNRALDFGLDRWTFRAGLGWMF